MSDLKERLEETKRESERATTWRPDPGDMLVGTFERMDEGETEYGTSKIAHLRDEDGKLWGVWLFHTVLRDRWTEADPEPGDKVGVVYLGERKGDPHSYHHYEVEVERREETDPRSDRSAEEPERDSPEFEGDQLFGEPSDGEESGESSLSDPNGELPY